MEISTLLSNVVAQNVKVYFHYGEIISKRSVPKADATIKLSGTTTELSSIPHLDSYIPQVGDICLVLINGTDMLIIGKVAT